MTWKDLVTPAGRSYSQLLPLERLIRESGCLLLPTPQAMDAMPARSPEAMHRQMTTHRKGRTRISVLKDVAVYGLNWTGSATRLGEGQLNRQYARWMMGFPENWRDNDT